MTEPYGLSSSLLDEMLRIYDTIPQLKWVKLYGSRAMGTYRYNSDIDIAFLSDDTQDLTGLIWRQLDDLSTPYEFDVTNYAIIENTALKDHIDRVGKIIWCAK